MSASIRFDAAPFDHQLRLHYRDGGRWRALPVERSGDGWRGEAGGVRASLSITPTGEAFAYELSFTSDRPTRLQLMLALPGPTGHAAAPFHLIPGVLFGDNNLAHAEPGHFPNLTARHAGNVSCSPYWEFRADRASHPVSMMCFAGGVAAVSIDPYSEGQPLAPPGKDGFIRNGLFAQLAHTELAAPGTSPERPEPHACGVTLGYGNLPHTFLNKDQWLPRSGHFVTAARATGLIFLLRAASRLDAHRAVRAVYARHREVPRPGLSVRDAAIALTDAFNEVNWHGPDGTNADKTSGGSASGFFGGGGFREQFTNLRCVDEAKQTLTAWRTLAEVGWTGGGVIGYPMLLAGHALGNPLAIERAAHVLDAVADAYHPASGLLWDVSGKVEGKRLNWWWSGYLVQDCHCAYTNGTAVYYLLKAYSHARAAMKQDRRPWLETACKVLDTIATLQLPDGGFGFTYSADRPRVLDPLGFAGCWFVPALAMAYRLTQQAKYLDAAKRGVEHYHAFVRDLNCWGAPMDTWKAVDQEGNLAFLRGALALHEATGNDRYLQMASDSAEYEYLWRVGFRARPEYAPLKDSPWNSCGGSITSVSNPHVHPMGVYITRELRRLAAATSGATRVYHADRAEDGLRWGIGCVALYPEVSGYGRRGVLTERYCPSDGLTVETFPDGSPSSLWFSYNGWAAAAVLEGCAESLD